MEIQKQYNQSPSRREFSSTHAYVHWLAEVQFAVFAPAFTLSFHDSECSRKPPMPIASVVMRNYKKEGVILPEKSKPNFTRSS